MTYAEIEAEIARALDAGLPLHAANVLAAFMQHSEALAVRVHCPDCSELLSVTEAVPKVWSVSCPCGRYHDTLKGV